MECPLRPREGRSERPCTTQESGRSRQTQLPRPVGAAASGEASQVTPPPHPPAHPPAHRRPWKYRGFRARPPVSTKGVFRRRALHARKETRGKTFYRVPFEKGQNIYILLIHRRTSTLSCIGKNLHSELTAVMRDRQ